MNCPDCGKPMAEMPTIPGYWKCPDYSESINDRSPYRYKCEGRHLTDQCLADFDEVLLAHWMKKQREQN